MGKLDVNYVEENVENVVNMLKAMSNDKRLLILCFLSKGEKSVGELENVISLSQSALSQHLARLRRDKIVKTRRQAQTIYYSISDGNVINMLGFLCSVFSDGEKIPLSKAAE